MTPEAKTLASLVGLPAIGATLIAAISIGLGLVPSTTEMARVSASAEKAADRLVIVERDTAVQAEQISNIEATVKRIETTQTQQHNVVMSAIKDLSK